MDTDTKHYKSYNSIVNFCELAGITKAEFADTMGWARTRIYIYNKDGARMNQKSFDSIINKFPNFIDFAIPSELSKQKADLPLVRVNANFMMSRDEIKRLYDKYFAVTLPNED
tara:strand:+ start:233 stop:571 length:339 start_codon:yes stop_codon:yes gene_type:complete